MCIIDAAITSNSRTSSIAGAATARTSMSGDVWGDTAASGTLATPAAAAAAVVNSSAPSSRQQQQQPREGQQQDQERRLVGAGGAVYEGNYYVSAYDSETESYLIPVAHIGRW
jgi:hypothetical protein